MDDHHLALTETLSRLFIILGMKLWSNMKTHKTALITGASRGMGKGIALSLAEMGYRLALIATNECLLQEVASAITQTYRLSKDEEPLVFALNVSDSQRVGQAVLQCIEKTKNIDVLVNAAGIFKLGTTDIAEEEFLEMLHVNLLGCFHCIHAVVPWMKKQRSGYIFNIASILGKKAFGPIGSYAASKFGLVGFNEAVFHELAEYGIKTTAICPGWVDTDMAAGSPLTQAEKIPVDDIAKTIRFLLQLSPSSYLKEVIIECRKSVETTNPSN